MNLQEIFKDHYKKEMDENTPLTELLDLLKDETTRKALVAHYKQYKNGTQKLCATFYPLVYWKEGEGRKKEGEGKKKVEKIYTPGLFECWKSMSPKKAKYKEGTVPASITANCSVYFHWTGERSNDEIMQAVKKYLDELGRPTVTVGDYWTALDNYDGWGLNLKKDPSKATKKQWDAQEKKKVELLDSLLPERSVTLLVKHSPGTNQTAAPHIDLAQYSKNIIFYGPPGTGKTRKAKIMAASIIMGDEAKSKSEAELRTYAEEEIKKEKGQIQLVQFHPSYSYFDFVEGIGVGEDGFKPQAKIFRTMCEDATQNKPNPYILIVDEINRADVSSVLGELLYGLEYRSEGIATSVMKEPLTVPKNLYVIGTMNTADQSIAGMDYAVRRRFAFEYVPVNENPTLREGEVFQRKLYETVKNHILESVARGVRAEDIMPGTSFFITKGDGHLQYKIRYELIPLLKEYAKNGLLAKRKIIKLESVKDEQFVEKSLYQYLMTKDDEMKPEDDKLKPEDGKLMPKDYEEYLLKNFANDEG